MKKLAIVLSSALLLVSFPLLAQGATKPITQIPMTLVTKLSPSDQTVGMVVRGKIIYLFGTITGVVSTDGFIQALDATGTVQWSLPLDNGGNEIATTATLDATGNIWVVGSAPKNFLSSSPSPTVSSTATPIPTLSATPTPTPIPSPSLLNPDGVTVVSPIPMRPDLTSLSLWKVSPAGALLATYTVDIGSAFLPRAVSIVNNSIAVAGIVSTTSGLAGVVIQADVNGNFGKPLIVGRANTQFKAIAKKSDGSLVVLGSSSETIANQKRRGNQDGVVVVISPAGKISSVVRSFNTSSARSWNSATNSLFFGGDAIGKAKTEAVVTKFGSTLAPTWTVRYASASPALTVDSPSSHLLLFASVGAITGVKGWKPRKGSALVLSLNSKGVLNGAYGASAITGPMAIGYSRDLGVVVLGWGPAGVSVFHTLPR